MTAREWKKVFPDEYGAWAMWVVPFLSGAQLAHTWNGKTLLWFCFLALFYIFKNPFVEWAVKNPVFFQKRKDKRELILISSIFPLIVLLGGIWFFTVADHLSAIRVTAVAVIFAGTYLLLEVYKLGRSLFGQWIGVFLLALAAPVTAVALGSRFDRVAIAVWLTNSLFFAHSIYTVRGWMNSRRRERQSQSAVALFRPLFIYWGATVFLAAAAIALRWIPANWAFLLIPTSIFIAVFVGGLFKKVTIRQIGFLEVGHTALFATALLILI